MWKLKALVTALLVLLLVGCKASPTSFSVSSTTVVAESEAGQTVSSSAPRIIDCPEALLQDFLAEHSLAYADPLSQDYPNDLVIPQIIQYTQDSLYVLSYEDTPFVGKENTARTSDLFVNTLYKYNFLTKEKQKIGVIDSSGMCSSDFLLTEESYYYFPLSIAYQENPVLYIKALSRASREEKDILKIEGGNINVSSGELRDGTVLFMIRSADGTKTRQRIYKLQGSASPEMIYDSRKEGLQEPAFSALAVVQDTIFLLEQTQENAKLKTKLLKMDSMGNALQTIELPGMEAYSDTANYADKLYVCGDYVFIKWYRCEEGLSAFSAYRLTNGQAQPIAVPDNAPCYLLTPNPVQNRYLIFSAFPNNMDFQANQYASHLYLLDTQNADRFIGLHFPLASDVTISEMVCNEEGNLMMSTLQPIDTMQRAQAGMVKVDFSAIKALL